MTDVTGKTGLARILFSSGLALVLAACATQAEITSDYDRSANFAAFHTFALNQREHAGISNPLVAVRVEQDISQALQKRGYIPAADPANADFAVDFSIGARDRLDIHSYPGTLPVGPLWGSNIDVRQYREGTLTIDIFDQRTHRPVWHAAAQKELTQKDLEQPAEPVSEAVGSVLAKFPPV
ncbi:MAG: DUF4136 domain-containing protein [Gammaproteobacteria bacterium]|nr:DUF4136 domain-containing protein [Gammaproteobacteria bacterium]MBV8307495.1 DUF4136 domain-containing protein [Gammaproteobacteria bacterium]